MWEEERKIKKKPLNDSVEAQSWTGALSPEVYG